MASIAIVKAGLLTTIQDGGRIGYQQFGIPTAGAMDQLALQLSNILVGNYRFEAGLEFTYMGPTIRFNDNSIFAITGGDFQPTLNGKKINIYQTIFANKGDKLKFASSQRGCRGYLAIAGGFDVKEVMGSKSTYLRGGFGGFEGRKLTEGDVLPLKGGELPQDFSIRRIPEKLIPTYEDKKTIRVILGPEADRFREVGIQTFLKETYQLSNQWDRMGYRLEGASIEHLNGADIISGGINLGAIQVPGDGKPIIMMADHQTTGGYTKIANVISVDLPVLAQMKPGNQINFKEVTIEEAHDLLRKQDEKIVEFLVSINMNHDKKDRHLPSREFKIKVNGRVYMVSVEEKI